MSDQKRIITGIDHPAIAAKDPKGLAKWYCAHFDYEVFFSNEKGLNILRSADGTMLEIMPCDETVRPERSLLTPGLSHLAFRVDDLQAAADQLLAEGIQVGEKTIEAMGGGYLKNVFDPEGNLLQIVQRP